MDLVEGIRAVIDEELIGGEVLFLMPDDCADGIAEGNHEVPPIALFQNSVDLASPDDDLGGPRDGTGEAADEIDGDDEEDNRAEDDVDDGVGEEFL